MSDALRAWLERTPPEAPVDPKIPIIDPHHHLWDRGGDRYLAAELAADLDSGHAFKATGYVECLYAWREDGPEALRPVGESAFVAATLRDTLPTRGRSVRGGAAMVAFADLSLGDSVNAVLDAHEAAIPERLRGIRYAVAWHEDPRIRRHHPTRAAMLMEPAVREGISALGQRGLVFDVWAYFTQLDEVVAAADACPDTVFVLNHFGAPIGIGPYEGKRAEVFAIWRKALAVLAQRSNMRVKMGGLGMPLSGFAFHKRPLPPSSQELAEAWRPYVETTLDVFGAERCMFESNYPVDRTAGRYGTIWNAFQRLATGMSPADKAAVFHEAAARAYRI